MVWSSFLGLYSQDWFAFWYHVPMRRGVGGYNWGNLKGQAFFSRSQLRAIADFWF